MRGVSAGVKVGILFLVAIAGVYIVWKNLSSNPAGDSSYGLWAQFRDASGLPVGSKVVVAGLPVGEISGLAIDGRYARVQFRIRDDVKVWSSGVAFKKSTSLLGDYYIEIDPGTDVDQAPDGTQQQHTLLVNGDRVPTVVESTSVDQLLRRIDETIPDVDAVLASVKDLSEELRSIVDGPIRSIAVNLDGLIQREGDTVSDILAKADRSMDRIDQITKDIREITGGADERVDRILDDVALQAKDLVATARAEVEMTGAKVRDKLDLVDGVIANAESITAKIDDPDKGTLGRLVNDSTIADNIEDITDDASGFLGTLFGLQTYVGLRSELNYRSRAFRHYLSVELHTRPDKFYLIEIERGPRGGYPDVSLTLDPTIDPDNWIRKAVIEDRTRFTFQFAKKMYGWLTLRYGIKESTGGLGADADLRWLERGLHLSLDVFDANFDRWPRLKVAAAVEVFNHIYVLGGIDEALNPTDELSVMSGGGDVPVQFERYKFGRDVFLGAMIRFNDKDLAALLAVGGSAISGIGN